MKNIITFCIVLLSALTAKAETQTIFNLQSTSGSVISIPFSKSPVVTYQGTTMIVKAEGTSDYSSDISSVSRIYYTVEDISTAVNEALREAKLTMDNNIIVISSLTPGEVVRIYGAGGQMSNSVRADNNGVAIINQDELPSGVTIIKYSTNTFKISK